MITMITPKKISLLSFIFEKVIAILNNEIKIVIGNRSIKYLKCTPAKEKLKILNIKIFKIKKKLNHRYFKSLFLLNPNKANKHNGIVNNPIVGYVYV